MSSSSRLVDISELPPPVTGGLVLLFDASWHDGSVEGGDSGVGVARASQAAVSKLYNSPLSKTTISLIASKYGAYRGSKASKAEAEELSAALLTALLLALVVGLLQLFAFAAFAGQILSAMGVSKDSDMAATAISYMRARALNAPVSTLWLVSNSVFRGLGDTKTPLLCSIL